MFFFWGFREIFSKTENSLIGSQGPYQLFTGSNGSNLDKTCDCRIPIMSDTIIVGYELKGGGWCSMGLK